MPREGIERIILKLRGGEKQLSRRVVPGWEIGNTDTFTQRLFIASPGGSYLAWSDPKGGSLRILGGKRARTVRGVFGRDVRFSADEQRLATIRNDGGRVEVVVVNLASGDLDALGTIGEPMWLEWVKSGVVVSHRGDGKHTITYFPLGGEKPVEVASGTPADLATRFTTAKRSNQAMYFFQRRAFLVNVESPVADARQVGELPSDVNNAEMAPDGSEATVSVVGSGVYRWRKGEELAQLGTESPHTLWYSADGSQLAYASNDKAVVLEGDARHELTTDDYDLYAMRFNRANLVVSMGTRALLWNPRTGTKEVLGTSGKGRTMQAADLYKGGAVLWTREVRRTDRRRADRIERNPAPFALAD